MNTMTRRMISISAACVATASMALTQPGLANAEPPKKMYLTSNATSITLNVTADKYSDQDCYLYEPGPAPFLIGGHVAAGTANSAFTLNNLATGTHNVEYWCEDAGNARFGRTETVSVPPGLIDQARDIMEGMDFGS